MGKKRMKKKVGFVTCVQLGLSCMEEIYRLGGNLDVIVTLKDDRARDKSGRIYLDAFAEEHKIPLIKTEHINDLEVERAVRERRLDWLFIIGWSQIAGKQILEAPRIGCIGMHPTLLPRGRGRASIPWAILKKLPETGVTMFRLDEGVDTGDIIAQEVIPLQKEITAAELYEKVKQAHIQLIRNNWEDIINGTASFRKQEEALATKWPGRRPSDGEITGDMKVEDALTLVRAVTHPYPGAFYEEEGKKWRIWSAKMADKGIKLADGYLQPVDYEIMDESENTGNGQRR